MTPPQILLIAVALLVVLTVGLGVALAQAVRFFSREVSNIEPPASRAKGQAPAKEAKVAAPAPPPAPKAAPPQRRTAGLAAVIFALVIIASGVAVGFFVRLMPQAASTEAGQIDILYSSMLGIAAAIFLLVEGLLIFAAFRFRRKPGDDTDGPPVHGSNRLELAWTVVPAVIVIWLGVYSYQVLTELQTPRPNAMLVEVTARQFQWQFRYPDTGVISNDLYVPQGQAVRLKLHSEDVIHSFWVPAFRIKQDAMPLRDTETFFTASALGEFPIVCAELCGAGHAQMGLTNRVIVQSPADFDAWMAEQAGAQPGDPAVALFNTTYACGSCHALDAANAAGQIGPDLNGIGARAAGRVPGLSAEDYLRQSILEPNVFLAPECPTGACAPGLMPQDFATRMPPPDLDALVAFLLQQ
jgi:cytochrome c oxidase subunit 2